MNSTNETKFWKGSLGRISWILTLIIGTILSITVINMKDIVLKFEILFAIIILTSFGLLLTYCINFYKDYNRIILSERVPMDAILKKENKKVIFDDATFSEDEAEVKIQRKLYNNMTESKEIYDRYKVIISSRDDVPQMEDITLTIGDEILELNTIDQAITKPIRCFEIDSNELDLSNPFRKKMEFFIPLHLKAGKTCEFKIGYLTKAYKKALQGKDDYTTMHVNRITDELVIEVILRGEMKDNYIVSPSVEIDGSTLTHKIFDASHERMKRTELQLKEKPVYREDFAIWTINKPKIGYRYRMYFKLLQK